MEETWTSWLVFCWVTFLAMCPLVAIRSHEIKGSYFIKTSELEKAPGVILWSRTIRKKSGRHGRHSTHYDIAYQFRVGGQAYDSDQVTFSYTTQKGKSFAESYVKKYPAGAAVTVYYESGNPSFSVLEPESKYPDNSSLGVLLVLVVLPGVMAVGLTGWKISRIMQRE